MTSTTTVHDAKPSGWRLVGIAVLSSAASIAVWYPLSRLLVPLLGPEWEILGIIIYALILLGSVVVLQSFLTKKFWTTPMQAHYEAVRVKKAEERRLDEERIAALADADLRRYEELEAERLLTGSEFVKPLRRRKI